MLPPDPHSWRLCGKNGCRDGEPAPDRRDRFWICQWSARSRGDALRMVAMRSLVSRAHRPWPVSGLSDDALVRHVADWMSVGSFHIHGGSPLEARAASGGGEAPKAAPVPRTERQPRGPSPPPPPDAPTFSADIDPDAQTAVLAAAAADGKPFCPE